MENMIPTTPPAQARESYMPSVGDGQPSIQIAPPNTNYTPDLGPGLPGFSHTVSENDYDGGLGTPPKDF